MKLPISERLLACCNFVCKGDRVADIGCDHGYLGIHLLTNCIASHMIESDVAPGPLESARRNAAKYGVESAMTFCLSDGVKDIPRDFDTLVCAGMGGDTMIHILESAPWLRSEQYRLILQCQSKRPELRKWLYDHGFAIRRETLAKDGKFCYPVTEVVYAPGESLQGAEFSITPALRASGSPLLPEFYDRVVGGIRTSVEGLSRTGGEKHEEMKAILEELLEMKEDIQ